MRALATLGVLETRQGDGTYVTELDPTMLLRPLGVYADLQGTAQSKDLLAVRRVLETEAAGLAATRLDDGGLDELEAILAAIDAVVERGSVDPEEFIDADAAFHRAIANASGNPALAGMVDALVTRTLRGRLWRAITERDSVGEATPSTVRCWPRSARTTRSARIRTASHLLGVEEFASAHPTETAPDIAVPVPSSSPSTDQ